MTGTPGRDATSPLLGILCITAAMTLLTVSDAIVRGLTDRLPIMAVVFLRSFVAVLPVLVMLHVQRAWLGLRTPRLAAQLARGALIIASYTLYLKGLTSGLSFALAVALVFTSPLFVALLSPIALGERVTARRWLGTIIGFAGVLVALQPGVGSFQVVSLYCLGSGLCYACSSLLARRLGANEPTSVTSFYTWLMFFLGSMPFALIGSGSWSFQDGDLGLLAVVGLIAGSAHFLIIAAYRHAAAAVVAPFEYVAMLWGTLFGFLFWDEVPGLANVAGIGLIIAGGLVIVYAERPRRPAGAAAD
ncbi:MAG: DMT family transporter [Alphaproteobacteria bacterium]